MIHVDPYSNINLFQEITDYYSTIPDTVSMLRVYGLQHRVFGNEAHVLIRRAGLFVGMQRWGEARADLELAMKMKSATIYPNEISRAYQYLGQINEHDKLFTAALGNLNRSLDSDPKNLEALYIRSRIYFKLGKRAEGIYDLKILKSKKYKDSAQILDRVKSKDQ